MNKEEKIAPMTEFYKQLVFTENAFDVNYKEVAKVLFNEVDRLNSIIDKTIEVLKDTSLDMPSTLLIETIDYARHILGDKE